MFALQIKKSVIRFKSVNYFDLRIVVFLSYPSIRGTVLKIRRTISNLDSKGMAIVIIERMDPKRIIDRITI